MVLLREQTLLRQWGGIGGAPTISILWGAFGSGPMPSSDPSPWRGEYPGLGNYYRARSPLLGQHAKYAYRLLSSLLSKCELVNDVLADLDHKLKIETESEMPKNRHGLKQSIKILGNGDNALYRLGDKMYLLEKRCTKANGYWLEFWCVTEKRVLQKKKIPRLNYITEDKWSVWYVRSFWRHAIQIMIVRVIPNVKQISRTKWKL